MSRWLGFNACPQFNIGKRQAVELFGLSADVDIANQNRARWGFPSCDSFLVRVLVADDGSYYDFHFIGWFPCASAVLECMDDEIWWERRFGHKCCFELFHVVDDGELWQAWDLEADAACGDVRAALSMYELFGIDKYLMTPKCLLCETARGPFLVVELREGTRNMCYQCYDAINTVRATMGYRPLRYITL